MIGCGAGVLNDVCIIPVTGFSAAKNRGALCAYGLGVNGPKSCITDDPGSADLSFASLAFRPQMFECVIKQLWAELELSGRAAETVGVACDVCGWDDKCGLHAFCRCNGGNPMIKYLMLTQVH